MTSTLQLPKAGELSVMRRRLQPSSQHIQLLFTSVLGAVSVQTRVEQAQVLLSSWRASVSRMSRVKLPPQAQRPLLQPRLLLPARLPRTRVHPHPRLQLPLRTPPRPLATQARPKQTRPTARPLRRVMLPRPVPKLPMPPTQRPLLRAPLRRLLAPRLRLRRPPRTRVTPQRLRRLPPSRPRVPALRPT